MQVKTLLPCLSLLLLCHTAFAQTRTQPPPPPRTYSVPSAAAPGKTTEVTFYGEDFDAASGLWTSFPAESARVTNPPGGGPDGPQGVTYRLTLPPETPVGIGAVRVATASGSSSLQLFMIDDLPSVPATSSNATPKDAQPLALPAAVDGACEEAGFDCFRFAAKAGQRLSVEVVAQRLGSRLDPVIRLLDATGRELAQSDDAPGAGADCRFIHAFAADGEYVLELRDMNYEGGPDYRYRLRVGDFPLPVVAFPLGGKRGAKGTFAVEGPGCDRVGPIELTLPKNAARAALAVRSADGQGSGFVSVLVGESEDGIEAEPNDELRAATRIDIPATVSGRFDKPGDRDAYRFEAKKGDRVIVRGRARALGSPCDLVLRLTKPDGSLLAEFKVTDAKPPAAGMTAVPQPPPDEGTVEATIPEDGTYHLVVEELVRRGGPGMAYRLELSPARPGFDLSVDADKVDAAAGGSFTLKVTCTRRDYAGPITLSLGGDAAGFAAEGNVIPEGENEAQLKVKIPAGLTPDRPLSFKIVGKADISGTEVARTASTLPALRKLLPRLPYPPQELDGLIGLGVRPTPP